MNAFELYHADGRKTGIWACGKCRIVHREERGAALCCEPRVCAGCGNAIPAVPAHATCRVCSDRRIESTKAAKWDAARKMPVVEYDGIVWDDDAGEYFTSTEAFEDDWYDRHDDPDVEGHVPPPINARVYACKPFRFEFDALGMVERALEDLHEDARDEIADGAVQELQALLDAWCEKHSPTSYRDDPGTALVWGPLHVPKHRQEVPIRQFLAMQEVR